MCRYLITFTDGSTDAGMAVGTESEVFAYLSGPGMRSLVVTQCDDITWPSADECPVSY